MARRERLRLPVRSRERRSHAERTAATRARIIAAVLECLADVGFERTTAAEITRRAGVTWGAVQHHFGGKDGILAAVLEDSFDRFAARLDDAPGGEVGLDKRARLFVERAWEHFRSPEYRSTFAILMHWVNRDDIRPPPSPSWQAEMFRAWDRIWMRWFADAPIPARRHRILEHYTIATLSGLASTRMLEGHPASEPESPASEGARAEELGLLQALLARELGRTS